MAINTNFGGPRTVKLSGGRSDVLTNSHRTGRGGGNILEFFKAFGQDKSNREALLAEGFSQDAIDTMSPDVLESTAAEVASLKARDLSSNRIQEREEGQAGGDLRTFMQNLTQQKDSEFQGFDPEQDRATKALIESGQNTGPSEVANLASFLRLDKADGDRSKAAPSREAFGAEALTQQEGKLNEIANGPGSDIDVGRFANSEIGRKLVTSAGARDRDTVDQEKATLANTRQIETANVLEVRKQLKEQRDNIEQLRKEGVARDDKRFAPKVIRQVDSKTGKLFNALLITDKKGNFKKLERIPGEAKPNSLSLNLEGLTKATKGKLQFKVSEIEQQEKELQVLDESIFGKFDEAGKQIAPPGKAAALFSTGGRIENMILNGADSIGIFNKNTTLGKVVSKIEDQLQVPLTADAKDTLAQYRKTVVRVGKVFTAFRKEITGVAGPKEEFERLEEISLSVRKLGIVGLRATLDVSRQFLKDRKEIINNALFANDPSAALAEINKRAGVRVEGIREQFADNPKILAAIDKAIAAADSKSQASKENAPKSNGNNVGGVLGNLLDLIGQGDNNG